MSLRLVIGAVLLVFSTISSGVINPLDPAKKILDDATTAANDVVNNAAVRANGLVINTADKVNIAVANTNLLLGSRLNKAYENLDEGEQKMLNEVDRLRLSLQEVQNSAYMLEKTAAVDLMDMEAMLQILADVPDFFFLGAQGLGHLKHQGGYEIKLLARGIGSSAKLVNQFTIEIDGKPIDKNLVRFQLVENGVESILLDEKVLEPYFKRDVLVALPVTIKTTVRRESYWIWHNNTYPLKLWLNLYPEHAAHVALSVTHKTFDWHDATNPVITGAETNEVSNKDGVFSMEKEVIGVKTGAPVVGSQKLSGCIAQCFYAEEYGVCAFVAGDWGVGTYEENNTKWKTTISTTTDKKTRWRPLCHVKEYVEAGTVTDPDIVLDLYYDQVIKIDVNADYTILESEVTSFSNQKYRMLSTQLDTVGTIKPVDIVAGPAGKKTLIFQVDHPKGM